nr:MULTISPECIES: glycosyltransferase family 1 protein [unclassified Methylobacterium]
MIHDAHTFNVPSSYPLIFRAAYQAALPLIGQVHAEIVTVSEYSKSELIRNGIASADKITVIYNGVDHMLRFNTDVGIIRALGLGGLPYFVGLSSVQPHKNIKMIINAFRDRRLESVRCVLIGPDRREEFAREGILVPDNIVFSGILTDDQLRGLLENSTATLSPSTTEGFGLLPLEGMILGCPTIVAPCGSLPEVCGAAAIYAKPDDEEGWIAAIADLRDAPQHRTMYSALGVAQAQKFTWSRAARRLLDVCERIAYSPVSVGVAR